MTYRWSAALIAVFFVLSCGDADVAPPATFNNTNNANNTNNSNNTNNQNTNNLNNTNNQNNQNNTNNLTCTPLDPALGPCDALCQTGCGAGEHCVTRQPTANDPVTTECELQMGAGQGADCDQTSDCGEGFSCRLFRGDQACRAYCRPGDPAPPQCPFDHACIPITDNRIGICVFVNHTCEVLPNDSCSEPGEECYNFPSGRRCEMAGDAMLGETCDSTADCVEGTRCVADGAAVICRQTCDPDNSQCPNDENCAELTDQNGQSLGWGACF